MTDNQLIAVRILIEKAKSQIFKIGTEKAFAALHAHDALDWRCNICTSLQREKDLKCPLKALQDTYQIMRINLAFSIKLKRKSWTKCVMHSSIALFFQMNGDFRREASYFS